ncbi:tetratricopeptide repeat protein [bacterium]|nr:tetratricopeptide repeat protein [bacterium]
MKNRYLVPFLMILLSVSVFSQGFQITKPDAVGGNLVTTNQDRASYPAGFAPGEIGVGPGVDFFIHYKLSPKVFLTTGLGISTVMDRMLRYENFKTTLLPSVEAKIGINPAPQNTVSPLLFTGLSLFGFQTTAKTPLGTFTSDRYYDGAVLVGGGLQMAINEQVSLQATGDYRYAFTSEGDPKPQFWTAKAGLSYHLNPQKGQYRDEMEYPLDEKEIASLDDLFLEEQGSGGSEYTSSDEADLAALFAPMEESAAGGLEASGSELDYPGTEEGRFNESVDNLRNTMSARSDRIGDLEARVEANEKALAQMAGRVAGSYTGESLSDDVFKREYQAALDLFYNKQYSQAIESFQALRASNPNHGLASNCQYWIGESYNALKNYRAALEAFDAVLAYHQSYKFDDALIMGGLVNLKLGDVNAARDSFQELVSRYPNSEYASKAMRYLGRL